MRAITAALVLVACDVGGPMPLPAELASGDPPRCGPERCNGVDDDCDGLIDEPDRDLGGEGAVPLWVDADGDGYGAGAPVVACGILAGFATVSGDCAPYDPWIFPGAVERCNGVDDDCDGLVDADDDPSPGVPSWPDRDGDTWGDDAAPAELRCPGADGWALRAGDCDDARFTRNPSSDETCNHFDDDCDGLVDDDDPDLVSIYFRDGDDDGFASADQRRSCTDRLTSAFPVDCDDADALTFPGSPHDGRCDGIAGDCVSEVLVPADAPDLATAAASAGPVRICLEPGEHEVDGLVALWPGTSIHGVGGSEEVTLVPPTRSGRFRLFGSGGFTLEGVRLGPVACDDPVGCDGLVTVIGGPVVLRDVALETVVCLGGACAPAIDVQHADAVVVEGLRVDDLVYAGAGTCGGVLRAQVTATGERVTLRDVALHDVYGACAGGDLALVELDAAEIVVDGFTVRGARLHESAPGAASLLRTDGDRVTLHRVDLRDVEARSLQGPHDGVLLRAHAASTARLVVDDAIVAGVRVDGDAAASLIAAWGVAELRDVTVVGVWLDLPQPAPLLSSSGAADLQAWLVAHVTAPPGPLAVGAVTAGEVGVWQVPGPVTADEPPVSEADPAFARFAPALDAATWDLHPSPASPVGHLGAYAGGDW